MAETYTYDFKSLYPVVKKEDMEKQDLIPEYIDRPPCPRCMPLVEEGKLDVEMVQPLPEGAMAPHAQDGSGPCCQHCGNADALMRFSQDCLNFEMARVAVGNDFMGRVRQPPDIRAVYGLGPRVRMPMSPTAMEEHHNWLDKHVELWRQIHEDED